MQSLLPAAWVGSQELAHLMPQLKLQKHFGAVGLKKNIWREKTQAIHKIRNPETFAVDASNEIAKAIGWKIQAFDLQKALVRSKNHIAKMQPLLAAARAGSQELAQLMPQLKLQKHFGAVGWKKLIGRRAQRDLVGWLCSNQCADGNGACLKSALGWVWDLNMVLNQQKDSCCNPKRKLNWLNPILENQAQLLWAPPQKLIGNYWHHTKMAATKKIEKSVFRLQFWLLLGCCRVRPSSRNWGHWQQSLSWARCMWLSPCPLFLNQQSWWCWVVDGFLWCKMICLKRWQSWDGSVSWGIGLVGC